MTSNTYAVKNFLSVVPGCKEFLRYFFLVGKHISWQLVNGHKNIRIAVLNSVSFKNESFTSSTKRKSLVHGF